MLRENLESILRAYMTKIKSIKMSYSKFVQQVIDQESYMPNLRPILSAIYTPGYNLAKSLIPILEPLTHNESTVKDSFSFAKEITNYDSSLFMSSLVVESLFTNIPLKETINNCVSDLQNKNLYNGKLNKSGLFKLLEAATSEFSLIFVFLLCKQIDGVAMGSPLGPTLANAFLCHYKKEWLDNCPSHFKPIVYRRYVDDILFFFHLKNISSFL